MSGDPPTIGTAVHPHSLADLIAQRAAMPPGSVRRTRGTVLSIQTGPPSLTMAIGGDPTPVPGVLYGPSYSPTVGDTVPLDGVGFEYVVAGTGAGSGGGGSTVRTLVYTFPGALLNNIGRPRLYFNENFTISQVRASVGLPSGGPSIILDILKGHGDVSAATESTIYTTTGNRPTLPAGAYRITAALPDIVAMVADDFLTVNIVQVGSPVPGSYLTVQLEGS